MISSLSQLNKMPYGGILKGKDISVGLKTDYDNGKVCETLEGQMGELKFKMSKLPNDLLCIQTQKENLYLNQQGNLVGASSSEDDEEYVNKSFLDCKI